MWWKKRRWPGRPPRAPAPRAVRNGPSGSGPRTSRRSSGTCSRNQPLVAWLGQESAGGDRVDGHAARRPVGRESPGERQHGRLRRLVAPAGDPPVGDQAGDRGHVDHAPPTARQHRAADDLRPDERARQVEVDDPLPVGRGERLGRHVDATSADVVDHDVDRPPILHDLIRGVFAGARLAHVRGEDLDLSAQRRREFARARRFEGCPTHGPRGSGRHPPRPTPGPWQTRGPGCRRSRRPSCHQDGTSQAHS